MFTHQLAEFYKQTLTKSLAVAKENDIDERWFSVEAGIFQF